MGNGISLALEKNGRQILLWAQLRSCRAYPKNAGKSRLLPGIKLPQSVDLRPSLVTVPSRSDRFRYAINCVTGSRHRRKDLSEIGRCAAELY